MNELNSDIYFPQVKVQQAKPPRASFAYPLGQPVRAAAKYPAGPEFYPIKVLLPDHTFQRAVDIYR